ncbi:MAG: SemiSWEET transporter [Deltaproteobacteria bacterium]|nr:SemiSWEET transporter [Deltaproteobacteria bacterium]
MDLETVLGTVAGVLTTAAFVPQVVKTWRTRSARDISGVMFAAFSIGVALWIVYGVLVRSAPVVVANSVTLLLALAVLGMKARFR